MFMAARINALFPVRDVCSCHGQTARQNKQSCAMRLQHSPVQMYRCLEGTYFLHLLVSRDV
jgi:hypothetical protein